MRALKVAARAALSLHESVVGLLLRPVLWNEHRRPPFGAPNERPAEYAFTLDALRREAPKRVLDVGSGRSSWPHLLATCGFDVTAIDAVQGYWSGAYVNRHWRVLRDDMTAPRLPGGFDAVTCLSVLEHVPDHRAAMRGLHSLVKPGGALLLSFPYNEKRPCEDVYRMPGVSYGSDFPYICRMYSREQLEGWCQEGPWTLEREAFFEVFEGELWAFGKRLQPIRESSREGRHHLGCFVLRRG